VNEKRRLEGFKALLNHDKANNYYLEEPDGDRRLWKDLSDEGRLGYIARAATIYNVPFEKFAEAVRDSIGTSAIADAALRTVLRDAHESRGLEQLLPEDGRTESTPLIDRFKEMLDQRWSAGKSLKKARTVGWKGRVHRP